MALLKDEDQRSKRRRDREKVGQHRLQRQDNRSGQQEEDHVRDGDHRADCERRLLQDEVHDIEVESGATRGQDLAVGHVFAAHRPDERARLIAGVWLVGQDVEKDDVLAGADRERFLHRRRQCVVRARVEVLVVRPAEVGVDVEDALHANDVRLGRKPAAQVVHRADVLRC